MRRGIHTKRSFVVYVPFVSEGNIALKNISVTCIITFVNFYTLRDKGEEKG